MHWISKLLRTGIPNRNRDFGAMNISWGDVLFKLEKAFVYSSGYQQIKQLKKKRKSKHVKHKSTERQKHSQTNE